METPSAITIDIDNSSGSNDVPSAAQIQQWLHGILATLKPHAELSVQLVDEVQITALNSQYRHQNKATNVLSFPADLPDCVDIPLLGDIVICSQVVNSEAVQQHKTADAHWAHMLVHGCLHLLGYDHLNDNDADAMELMETQIITRLGFPPPYHQLPSTAPSETACHD